MVAVPSLLWSPGFQTSPEDRGAQQVPVDQNNTVTINTIMETVL